MFEKFTNNAAAILQAAQNMALARGHQRFTPEHILHALLEDKDGIAVRLLQASGGNVAQIRTRVSEELARMPKVTGGGAGNLQLAPETARVFESANELAQKAKDEFITKERLLQAIAINKD